MEEGSNYIICPSCGINNPLNHSFCYYCGKTLDKKYYCINCHQIIPEQAKYCLYCGQNQSDNTHITCPNCGSVDEYENFCKSCGTPLKSNNNSFQSIPDPNTAYYTYNQPQSYYFPHQKMQKPAWWKIPIFYIILGVFGLSILTQLIIIFGGIFLLSFVTVITANSINDMSFQLLLGLIVQITGLILLIIAVNRFFGFKSFWKQNSSSSIDSENETTQDNDLKSSVLIDKKQKAQVSILEIVAFLIILVALLNIIDTVMFYIITAIKDLFSISAPFISAYDSFGESTDLYILFALTAIFFAPIHEELLFRGYLQQALERSGTADWAHYVIQGVSFAFLHLAGDILLGGTLDFIVLHMISTATFGVAATWLKKKTGKIIYPILFHGLANTTSVLFTIFSDLLPLEADTLFIDLILFFLMIGLVIILLSILNFRQKWTLNKPLSLKNVDIKSKSTLSFIARVFIFIGIFELLQYGFLIISDPVQILGYFLFISALTALLYYFWGKKIMDIPWSTFYPENEKKKDSIKEDQINYADG